MRKYSLSAMFFSLMLCLSVTASYACTPGCPCDTPAAQGPAGGSDANPENSGGNSGGVLGAINRHGEAIRVREKAQTQQHIKQNDNGPGMTCFDRALGMTQQLGQIFSDVIPNAIPARNDAVFGASSFPDMGISNFLGEGLSAVVQPMAQAHATNFVDSLSALLGATEMFAFVDDFRGQLTGFVTSLTAPINSINTAMGTFNTYYNTISSLMTALGATVPQAVVGIVTMINSVWSMIQNFINSILSAILTTINTIFTTITTFLSNLIGQIFAQFAPDGVCARIEQLWGNGFPSGFRSLIGQAVERGTPYFTMIEMLQNNIPSTMGIAGRNLVREITRDANSDIINRALNDLLPGGMLSGPGSPDMPTFPMPPTFTPGSVFNDIRLQF
jgi:hypothetical protein